MTGCFFVGMNWEETARPIVPLSMAGDAGMGFDTVLEDSAALDAASSAALALRFSASNWDMAELAWGFFGPVGLVKGALAGDSVTTDAVSGSDSGFAFSSCFLAVPSRESMIACARVFHTF